MPGIFMLGMFAFRRNKMRMLGRRLVLIALATAGVVSANAATFTNITVTGTGFGQFSNFGANGLTFNLADNFLIGTGSKVVTINYHVDADPGMSLSDFTVSPVGVTQNGSVNIDVNHVGEFTSNYVAIGGGSPSVLGSQTFALSATQTGYDVVTTITLNGLGANSINKATIYNVSYTQQPVPEPATMAVLGLGIAALVRRRRSK